MQRTLESANPVLRRRTSKVSMALATVQASSPLNFSNSTGAKLSAFIKAPMPKSNGEQAENEVGSDRYTRI
jgi:hypothetical protein